jgi:hypothetical protein
VKHKNFMGLAVVLLIAQLLLLGLVPNTAIAASPPNLTTLQPGGFRALNQNLKVNIVFVGYETGAGVRDIDQNAFTGGLSTAYRTINRYPDFYGIREYLGVDFSYNYNMVYANSAFESAFFGYLGSIAQPKPLTVFQEAYNDQPNRSLTVTNNHWIEVSLVEKWLAQKTKPMLGVDTSQYTVFLINWYGRGDFKFHTYVKTDEPDPDTGYNFGTIRDSRKMIAWGGTTPDDEESGLGSLHRIWFYDLSAGPESWTDNFDINTADVDGNGVLDYRMPPIWEYGNLTGYRPFNNLSADLSKVVRYVAIDLLFTTSPLYKPAISAPKLPSAIQLDINVYQAESGVDAKTFFDLNLLVAEINELQPYIAYSAEINDTAFSGRAADVYNCFVVDVSCYGNRLSGIAFGDLFLYHQDKLNQFIEGDSDYEIPIFAYNTPDAIDAPLLGFADDNWRNGTQSYVFGFDSPGKRAVGYGFTTTFIHEVGHHIGMSHPHDGYDYQANIDYGNTDQFHFAGSGDQSNSIMSYIDVNWDFSQFDRDNMNRYMTATYINQANSILAKIYASPRAGEASSLLLSADSKAASAITKYNAMNYPGAVTTAKQAYQDVLAAAAKIGVKVETQSYQADYKAKGKSPKFVDTVNYQRSRP